MLSWRRGAARGRAGGTGAGAPRATEAGRPPVPARRGTATPGPPPPRSDPAPRRGDPVTGAAAPAVGHPSRGRREGRGEMRAKSGRGWGGGGGGVSPNGERGRGVALAAGARRGRPCLSAAALGPLARSGAGRGARRSPARPAAPLISAGLNANQLRGGRGLLGAAERRCRPVGVRGRGGARGCGMARGGPARHSAVTGRGPDGAVGRLRAAVAAL